MSTPSARLLNLDAFVPRAIEVEMGGVVHRVPGGVLTADLVIALQELGEKAVAGDQTAVLDIIDLLDGVMQKADPPLSVRDIPVPAISPLAQFLVEGAGAGGEDVVDPPRAARRRAASSTTPRSPQPRPRK